MWYNLWVLSAHVAMNPTPNNPKAPLQDSASDFRTYFKAYETYAGSKKLYYFDPIYVAAKQKVLSQWRKHVSYDALELEFPLLVPRKILEDSGHLKQFGNQVFEIENETLCLRPEAAIAVFTHMSDLKNRYLKKKENLCIAQYGRAFRNQSTTRDRHYRLREFDQMEIQILADAASAPADFFRAYDARLQNFFKALNLAVHAQAVQAQKLPHYSLGTVDYYFTDPSSRDSIELGCLSNRGNHDLKDLRALKQGYVIYECSLGLTRIVLAYLAAAKL